MVSRHKHVRRSWPALPTSPPFRVPLFATTQGRQKISLAKMFLGCKLNLLLVDVDVVLLRNVMDYFERCGPP